MTSSWRPPGPSLPRARLCSGFSVSAFSFLTTAPLFCLYSHNERRNTFLHPLTGQAPEENKKFDLKMYVYSLATLWPLHP